MKKYLKIAFCVASYFFVLPFIIISKFGIIFFHSDELFIFSGQLLSLIPGLVGSYCRLMFYKNTLQDFKFDWSFKYGGYILFGTVFSKRQTRVGKNLAVAGYSIIGYAEIGNNVAISNRVHILSGRRQHNFSDPNKGALDETASNYTCVKIGDNVYIGDGSIVMANIGEGSIVGAGSVVVKEIPPYSIAVGNPAKVIKSRNPQE